MEEARAYDHAEQQPGSEIGDFFWRNTVAHATSAGCPKSRQETECGENSVPMNGKFPKMECNRIHYLNLSPNFPLAKWEKYGPARPAVAPYLLKQSRPTIVPCLL